MLTTQIYRAGLHVLLVRQQTNSCYDTYSKPAEQPN